MARMTQLKILELAYEAQFSKWLITEKQMNEMPGNFMAREMYNIAHEELLEIKRMIEEEKRK